MLAMMSCVFEVSSSQSKPLTKPISFYTITEFNFNIHFDWISLSRHWLIKQTCEADVRTASQVE